MKIWITAAVGLILAVVGASNRWLGKNWDWMLKKKYFFYFSGNRWLGSNRCSSIGCCASSLILWDAMEARDKAIWSARQQCTITVVYHRQQCTKPWCARHQCTIGGVYHWHYRHWSCTVEANRCIGLRYVKSGLWMESQASNRAHIIGKIPVFNSDFIQEHCFEAVAVISCGRRYHQTDSKCASTLT